MHFYLLFQEAIDSVSSIAEAEYLQNILQSGRIPEGAWNRGGFASINQNALK